MNPLTQKEYHSLHTRLRYRHAKTGVCGFCKEFKMTEFALKKGSEYSLERNDYLELCKSCHKRYDFTEEVARKLAETRKRITPESYKHLQKPILLRKNGGELKFESMAIAARELKLSKSAMANVLAGRALTTAGYSLQLL